MEISISVKLSQYCAIYYGISFVITYLHRLKESMKPVWILHVHVVLVLYSKKLNRGGNFLDISRNKNSTTSIDSELSFKIFQCI